MNQLDIRQDGLEFFCAPDDLLEGKLVHVTGFPGDKGEKDKQSTQMWTMSHVKNVLDNRITYEIDTAPGQSGSGIWTQWDGFQGYHVVAIHTYGARNTSDESSSNFGTRICCVKFECLINWMKQYQLKDFIHPSLPTSEEQTARALFMLYKREAKKGDDEAQHSLGLCFIKKALEKNGTSLWQQLFCSN
jgi:hypothetical protein